MAAVDGQLLRDQTRQMKEYVLRHLPDLLEELERNVMANGGHVHWARGRAPKPTRSSSRLRAKHQVQKVVKAKSMATEEIHLNEALEAAGITVVETDLGEYIIQLADEPPSHIVAPVVHKRLEDIAEVFQRELDMPPTLDPEVMCSARPPALRQEFLQARTWASAAATLPLPRPAPSASSPTRATGAWSPPCRRVYVAVMGIEKLVPTVEDAFLQYQALCRSSHRPAVQRLSLHDQRSARDGDVDGPEEFHVVLLDNGRSDMLAKGYGEALMCMRCGACLNVCPVYREIGGHAYGSTYSGPIGAVISPLLHTDVTDAEKLPHASSLCGACRDACPVKIDLPRLLLDLRSDQVEDGEAPWVDRQAMQGFVQTMQSRGRYESVGKMGSFGQASWPV